MEELYVYAGENTPRVRLTLLKRYPSVEEVTKFLFKTQDTYSLQLNTIETITGNLKIRCGTHENCQDCPYYILEFNEVNNDYSLWKLADMDWKFGNIVASLYGGTRERKKQGRSEIAPLPETVFARLPPSVNRHQVTACLQSLCVPLSKLDWEEFAELLNKMLAEKQVSGDDMVILKGVVSLTALRAAVSASKRELKEQLQSYDRKVKAATAESTRTSSPSSMLPSNSPSSSLSSIHYTYGMPATQLDTNFKEFFRSMAENFELFDEPHTIIRGRVTKAKKRRHRSAGESFCGGLGQCFLNI